MLPPAWLLSLVRMFVRLVYTIAYDCRLLILTAAEWSVVTYIIYSSDNGHLGTFQFGAVTNSTVLQQVLDGKPKMNLEMLVSRLWTKPTFWTKVAKHAQGVLNQVAPQRNPDPE